MSLISRSIPIRLALVGLVLLSTNVLAHIPGKSNSDWIAHEDGKWEVTVNIETNWIQLKDIAVDVQATTEEFVKMLTVENCNWLESFTLVGNFKALHTYRAILVCDPGIDPSIDYSKIANAHNGHLHLVRHFKLKETLKLQSEVLLNTANTKHTLSVASSEDENTSNSLFTFFTLGFEHLATGIDHLVLIFALTILLFSRIRLLLMAIFGFTIGHSISLFLVAIETIKINQILVELMIALSIVVVALEAVFKTVLKQNKTSTPQENLTKVASYSILLYLPLCLVLLFFNKYSETVALIGAFIFSVGLLGYQTRYQIGYQSKYKNNYFYFMITTCIGLVHGAGFGSFLKDAIVSSENPVYATLVFNIGVEVAQIACLILIYILGFSYMFIAKRINSNKSELIATNNGTVHLLQLPITICLFVCICYGTFLAWMRVI